MNNLIKKMKQILRNLSQAFKTPPKPQNEKLLIELNTLENNDEEVSLSSFKTNLVDNKNTTSFNQIEDEVLKQGSTIIDAESVLEESLNSNDNSSQEKNNNNDEVLDQGKEFSKINDQQGNEDKVSENQINEDNVSTDQINDNEINNDEDNNVNHDEINTKEQEIEAESDKETKQRAILIKPRNSKEAKIIAKRLMENNIVVLNLNKVSEIDFERIRDFVSGTLFSLDGDYRKVNSNTAVLLPSKSVDEIYLDLVLRKAKDM